MADVEREFMEQVWLSTARGAKAIGDLANWTVGGAAASVALIISSLGDGNAHVHDFELHLTLLLLITAVVSGTVARYFGVLAASTGESLEVVAKWIATDQAKRVIAGLPDDKTDLSKKVVEPFLWPLSVLIARGISRDKDPFHRMVLYASLQSIFTAMHFVVFVSALITFVVGLN